MIRLKDAGVREQVWAQHLIATKQLPKDITFADMLNHAMYDASKDCIVMTIKAVALEWKVERP